MDDKFIELYATNLINNLFHKLTDKEIGEIVEKYVGRSNSLELRQEIKDDILKAMQNEIG